MADFKAFVDKANKLGLEVAIDLALQASPDHPWVTEHPEWFTHLPDGTIRFAENPPKKYQDIYPINFDDDYAGLQAEVLRIVELWISQGVTIFRVDNPHTKPASFWEWLIATVRAKHPDIVFLAEAFTRPKPMQLLAKAGFQQSYTYFTWRNSAAEIAEYFQEVSHQTDAFFRPNFFVNTPDILTEYLSVGGRGAHKVKAALAATGSPAWGMYSGYELVETEQRAGSEEQNNNEKYEYRPRDFAKAAAKGASIEGYITRLNQIRRENPALHQLRNITIHHSEDQAVIAFSKSVPGNTIIVVANTAMHSVIETMIHLDLDALGHKPGAKFVVTELLSGQKWNWSEANYVRLAFDDEPAHILRVETEQNQ